MMLPADGASMPKQDFGDETMRVAVIGIVVPASGVRVEASPAAATAVEGPCEGTARVEASPDGV